MNRTVEGRLHRPFTLVLSGGGARGFAHVGVLRALEAYGFRPSAIVGVSMGAVVGVTYALRADWYPALVGMDTSGFPEPEAPPIEARPAIAGRVRAAFGYLHAMWRLFVGWGVGGHALSAGRAVLRALTGGRNLEDGRIPIAVCATELRAGERFTFKSGNAAEAAYASAALAGVLPPLRLNGRLLADGAYADIAPIDVARAFGYSTVIAVDPGQLQEPINIRNGFQALMRAVEICYTHHAHLRFDEADLVLRPAFDHTIDTFDFNAKRSCVAAGIQVVRKHRRRLERMLCHTSVSKSS